MEREGMRVVAHGAKWCRPQPVGRKTAPIAAASGPSVFEQRFWFFADGVVFLWVCLRVFDFTLLPPAHKGLLITQPFCGLHSWASANGAWAARSHLKYGLGYTKGLRTLVVGDPPPLIPEYYVSHPPLETWILALGMSVFGTQDWSVHLVELVLSMPCLLLILLILRRLHAGIRGHLAYFARQLGERDVSGTFSIPPRMFVRSSCHTPRVASSGRRLSPRLGTE
jgi:hypothetical protein